jgi:hypothetical protein
MKSTGRILGVVVFASLMLGRCAFEAGSFSDQVISVPNEVIFSSIVEGNDGNELVDEFTNKIFRQIQEACWKSGWRGLVRSFFFTGPSSVSIEIRDNFIGSRQMTLDCSKF